MKRFSVEQIVATLKQIDLWAYRCGAAIDFNRPGKPPDNCFIETFNRSFRDECPNVRWTACVDVWRERRRRNPTLHLVRQRQAVQTRTLRTLPWH